MNEILIKALANRVLVGDMEIEQVPIPFQETIEEIILTVNEELPENEEE